MDPEAFRSDLDGIPDALDDLADAVAAGDMRWPIVDAPRRLVLTGMGSSYFAAEVCARRMRSAGIDAVAEIASAQLGWPPSPDTTLVAISATGASVETIDAIAPHCPTSRVVALTNRPASELSAQAHATIEMHAGDESGGVACRSFRNTIGALFALEAQLLHNPPPVDALRRAADATAHLLDTIDSWLPEVLDVVDHPDGVWFLAPAERLSSALQGALMVREGPRRRADGCETGDWSHVDVYLTKTLDYRAVVYPGSRYDAAAADWMQQRGSRSVAIGAPFPGASCIVAYPGADDTAVALLTEPLIAELIAASWWVTSARE